MEQVSITHYQSVNSIWLQLLDLYKQETSALKDKLTNIVRKNPPPNLLTQASKYDEQLNEQLEQIDQLRSEIASTSEQLMQTNDSYLNGTLLLHYDRLKESFISEERTFNEVRQSFKKFAAALEVSTEHFVNRVASQLT